MHWLSFIAARVTIYKADSEFGVRGTARNTTVSGAAGRVVAQVAATQRTANGASDYQHHYQPSAADAATTAVSAPQTTSATAATPAAADCAEPVPPEGATGTVLLVHAAGPDVCGFKSDANIVTGEHCSG